MSLFAGTAAPDFAARAHINPRFAFNTLGGRYVLLAFLPRPGAERDAALRSLARHRDMFDDSRLVFFGVLPDVESFEAMTPAPPFRWFLDETGEVRRLYAAEGPNGEIEPQWVLVDPTLRIMDTAPLDRVAAVIEALARLGDPDDHAATRIHAPVLIVPRILEPELCRRLIDLYHTTGGVPSGVMRHIDGQTVPVLDEFKRRHDATITDKPLIDMLSNRIAMRLIPQIRKSFQSEVNYIERFIVACYDAADGGYFNAHRDNTTPVTAHRKFAVSINLNAEDFEGGDLRFPEFGRTTYRPPTGGAVVFSCSLLHEALPVTRGVRFAFLPFLYDQAGADLRARNLPRPTG